MIKRSTVLKSSLIVIAMLTFLPILMLSRAYIVADKNGLYQFLFVPLINEQAIRFRLYMNTNRHRTIDIGRKFYGPIFRLNEKLGLQAHWICENVNFKEVVSKNSLYEIRCDGDIYQFDLTEHDIRTPKNLDDNKVYIFSDLHGNIEYFRQVLINLKVIDSDNNWLFGKNGLVILGDFVDKSSYDRELLWYLYFLERLSNKQGGFVSIILGNHETFQLSGDFRHAHPVTRHLTRKLIPLEQSLDDKTLLGRWLRTKPVVATMNNYLFIHAGVSPSVISKVDIQSLNTSLANYWRGDVIDDDSYQAIFGPQGILNYRGMIKKTDHYPALTTGELTTFLSKVSMGKIIFGHTEMEEISFLHKNKAIAVDASRQSSKILMVDAEHQELIETGVLNHNEPWLASAERIPFNILLSQHWSIIYSALLQGE